MFTKSSIAFIKPNHRCNFKCYVTPKKRIRQMHLLVVKRELANAVL